ncbi:hypothetical protein AAUPMC_11446 [Pasteurella multocida subsp. multocida str. Anand1_cattle]|nr:hypothetical protein AAUPMC_11446 [Pasteurella multocida subsp. multocida str. Anand1_cattle]
MFKKQASIVKNFDIFSKKNVITVKFLVFSSSFLKKEIAIIHFSYFC